MATPAGRAIGHRHAPGGADRRPAHQHRRPGPRPCPGPAGRLRSRPAAGRQGTTQDGPLHPLRPGRRARGPGPGRLGAAERRGAGAHGDRHRLRGGRLPCHRRSGADHRRQGTATPVALHHPVLSLQHGGRPCVDPPWLQGTAGRPGDRLRGGRASHRRRGADDPRGRGRRGALRRRGSDHPPGQPGRLRRRARPVQRFQRQPRTRLAPLRPGPRRLRHGRRRRPTGHRGTGARPGGPCSRRCARPAWKRPRCST